MLVAVLKDWVTETKPEATRAGRLEPTSTSFAKSEEGTGQTGRPCRTCTIWSTRA